MSRVAFLSAFAGEARCRQRLLRPLHEVPDNWLSLEFGRSCVRIPLAKSPHIVHRDALEPDWSGLLPPDDCSFVFGNPPFVGAKYPAAEQRAQVRGIAALGKTDGTLDYVAAWFIRAGEYVKGSSARIGFVATNSITQGERVAQLWPVLFEHSKLETAFAHRTFTWGSDARGKAQVHVVILGLDRREASRPEKRLFSYPDINGEPEESGHAAFLDVEPEAEPWLRPFIGAREYLQGSEGWILALHDAPPDVLARLPRVRERIAAGPVGRPARVRLRKSSR